MSVDKAYKTRIKTGCGDMHVSRAEKDGKPNEVFATIGKAGGCALAFSETHGRMASLILKKADLNTLKEYRPNVISIEDEMVKEFKGIQCHKQPIDVWDDRLGTQVKIKSCSDAIAKGLERIKDEIEELEGEEETRI